MALEEVKRTIGGVEKDAYVVTGTGATEEIILKETLLPIDIQFLTLASEATGTDLKAKMVATTLPNGMNAYAQFEQTIELTDVLVERAKRWAIRKDTVGAILELQEAAVAPEEGGPNPPNTI